MEFSKGQLEFLSNILEQEVTNENIESILKAKNYKLYECKSCGKLILHDNYEFWNITECCDDNSKIMDDGTLMCEVCYSRSFDNMMSWLNRRPEWTKEVKFDIKRRE
ncbi:hypothetical protein [Hydrogenobaculum acidophilum]